MKHIPAVFKKATFLALSLGLLAVALISATAFVTGGELWLSLSFSTIAAALGMCLIGYMMHNA